MNYGAMPGQRVTANPNPVTGNIGSAPFNFSSYAPSSDASSAIGQTAGSNQYQQLPPWMAMGNVATAYNTPGLGVPPQGSSGYGNTGSGWTGAGGGPIVGGGPFSIEQPAYPNISNVLANYVGGQVGQGVSPFNLSTALPFGGTTQPGQLNAMANPLLQNLMSFYQGGQSSTPGANTLATIANQGISALPEWQSMVNAMGQNTAQNQAQLQEQFAGMGGLAGTPFGNAASNFQQGVANQQQALLGQLQQQNILQGQIPAAEGLFSGAQQFGQYGQALNQQSIQNMLNEYIRTSPQYNPMLQYAYGLGTTYDPVLNRAGTTGGGILAGLNLSPSFSFPSGGSGTTFL